VLKLETVNYSCIFLKLGPCFYPTTLIVFLRNYVLTWFAFSDISWQRSPSVGNFAKLFFSPSPTAGQNKLDHLSLESLFRLVLYLLVRWRAFPLRHSGRFQPYLQSLDKLGWSLPGRSTSRCPLWGRLLALQMLGSSENTSRVQTLQLIMSYSQWWKGQIS